MELFSIDKQAILLLSAYFGDSGNKDVNPLTPTEYGRFADWLLNNSMRPGDLLSGSLHEKLKDWSDKKITISRLEQLLSRGASMSLSVEKWDRTGLWILTRNDPVYPFKLKKKLSSVAPPILFGSGNKKLLNSSGVAVVGSRKIENEDLEYSKNLGIHLSVNNLTVFSGGAKGVDETAMLAALENDGTAVGVLADNLKRRTISKSYRKYIMDGKLAFVSPFYPEAGFNVGNAMARNKYIYCLSEIAVVVHSGLKGGTWNGALENLKKRWIPLWIKPNSDKHCGNSLLIDRGAQSIENKIEDISFEGLIKLDNKDRRQKEVEIIEVQEPHYEYDKPTITPSVIEKIPAFKFDSGNSGIKEKSMYEIFVIKLVAVIGENMISKDDLKKEFDIMESQLNKWLQRARKDGIIKKLNKPVRYAVLNNNLEQLGLFS